MLDRVQVCPPRIPKALKALQDTGVWGPWRVEEKRWHIEGTTQSMAADGGPLATQFHTSHRGHVGGKTHYKVETSKPLELL